MNAPPFAANSTERGTARTLMQTAARAAMLVTVALMAAPPTWTAAANGQTADQDAVWQQLDLTGPDAKLPPLPTWHERRHGWKPVWGIGGGVMWFEGDAELDTAPFGQLSLTWPRALHRRVGVEVFTNYARASLDCTRTVTDIVFVPDPGAPSEDPGYEPPPDDIGEDVPTTGGRVTVDPGTGGEGSTGDGVVPVERKRRQRRSEHGDVWQVGVGIVPLLVQTDVGGTPLTLAGRLGISVTVFDFDCDSDTAPGVYAGLVLEMHPTERVSVGIDAMLHAVDADFGRADGLLSATAGARVAIAF